MTCRFTDRRNMSAAAQGACAVSSCANRIAMDTTVLVSFFAARIICFALSAALIHSRRTTNRFALLAA